jgi:hypothetical protein
MVRRKPVITETFRPGLFTTLHFKTHAGCVDAVALIMEQEPLCCMTRSLYAQLRLTYPGVMKFDRSDPCRTDISTHVEAPFSFVTYYTDDQTLIATVDPVPFTVTAVPETSAYQVILGRPFLAAAHAHMDYESETLTMCFTDKESTEQHMTVIACSRC